MLFNKRHKFNEGTVRKHFFFIIKKIKKMNGEKDLLDAHPRHKTDFLRWLIWLKQRGNVLVVKRNRFFLKTQKTTDNSTYAILELLHSSIKR